MLAGLYGVFTLKLGTEEGEYGGGREIQREKEIIESGKSRKKQQKIPRVLSEETEKQQDGECNKEWAGYVIH